MPGPKDIVEALVGALNPLRALLAHFPKVRQEVLVVRDQVDEHVAGLIREARTDEPILPIRGWQRCKAWLWISGLVSLTAYLLLAGGLVMLFGMMNDHAVLTLRLEAILVGAGTMVVARQCRKLARYELSRLQAV